MLAQLKISCLEHIKKDAKQRYQEALRSYVVEFMGKPLDRLSVKSIFYGYRLIINLLIEFFLDIFR